MTPKKRSQAKSKMTLSFQFTVSPVENGYRLQVSYGEDPLRPSSSEMSSIPREAWNLLAPGM